MKEADINLSEGKYDLRVVAVNSAIGKSLERNKESKKKYAVAALSSFGQKVLRCKRRFFDFEFVYVIKRLVIFVRTPAPRLHVEHLVKVMAPASILLHGQHFLFLSPVSAGFFIPTFR